MKKWTLSIILFFVFLNGFSQQIFIDQTKKEVRDFWELNVSIEYFQDGKWDDTGNDYFMIMLDDVGVPDFSATFDKKGLCKSQSMKIGFDNISVLQARLKKAGFNRDKTKGGWVKPGEDYFCKISQQSQQTYTFSCNRFVQQASQPATGNPQP